MPTLELKKVYTQLFECDGYKNGLAEQLTIDSRRRAASTAGMLDDAPPVLNVSSALERRWRLRDADERATEAIAQAHGLPAILSRILAARGVGVEAVARFLSPSLRESLPDPAHLLDMQSAAERIAGAAIAGERVAIFGDYDVDGATSSALLARYLRALGLTSLVYIPDRMKEGYGPNAPALLALKAQGATVVITVDCGTLSFEPLEAAFEAGLDVIVVDHHIGEARKPKAFAVVNPNRFDETSPHGHLAAVGVAFLLIVQINRALRERGWFVSRQEPDTRQWLDLVALGTVCDVVPLVGINRAFVAQGLKIMAARRNVGIRTLLDMVAIDESPGVYHAGFVVGPRINAGGRVGRSDLGARLLATDDDAEALALARELHRHNEERRAIESMVLEQAMEQAARVPRDAPMLLLAGRGWHPGVIGIVAGRVKERFHKPVAVVALADGTGKASARSVSGVDLGNMVIAARDAGLLLAGGGHAMAAGFTLEEGKLEALREFFYARLAICAEALKAPALMLDGVLTAAGATPELIAQLERLGPFGQGNPAVRIMLKSVVNLRPEPTADGAHVRTLFIDSGGGSGRVSAIAFRAAQTPLGQMLLSTRGRPLHTAGTLRLQTWQGRESVSFMIEDAALASE